MSFSSAEIFESMADDVARKPSSMFASLGLAEHDGYGTIHRKQCRDLLDKVAFMVLRLQADGVRTDRTWSVVRRTTDFTMLAVSRRCSEIREANT